MKGVANSMGIGNQEKLRGKGDLCSGSRLQEVFLISNPHRTDHFPRELRIIQAANDNQLHCDSFSGLNYPHQLLE